jgi:hypothetical protein
MKTIYESFDGKQFENKTDCIQYEQTFFKSKAEEFFNIVKQIREHCNNTDGCRDCPFFKEDSCGFKEITTSTPWDW